MKCKSKLKKKKLSSLNLFLFYSLALKYGNLALGGANALTNVAISSFYRDRFKLTKFSGIGLVSSVFLTGIFPSITTSIFTQLYFTENLLAFDNSECALCREIKTLAGFFVIGNLIPTGLSWITNFYQASALNTIKIPNTDFFIKNYKEKRNRVFYYDGMKKLFRETNIKMSGILLFNYSLQIILCSALMFFQRKQFTEKIEPSSFTIAEIKKIKN